MKWHMFHKPHNFDPNSHSQYHLRYRPQNGSTHQPSLAVVPLALLPKISSWCVPQTAGKNKKTTKKNKKQIKKKTLYISMARTKKKKRKKNPTTNLCKTPIERCWELPKKQNKKNISSNSTIKKNNEYKKPKKKKSFYFFFA